LAIPQRQQMRAQSRAHREDNDFSHIELVDRLLRGEHGASDLFYRRYERLIYHCIRTRADAADVDDIFQSFFQRLLERDYHVLRVWQRGSSLPIYLSTVIRNFVFDFYRKKQRREGRETSVGGLSDLEKHEPEREETLPTAIDLDELKQFGLHARNKLNRRDRQLICSKFYQDLTNEEMAKQLNLTSGALRTALSRAVKNWLDIFKTLAPEYF
jgi:RNA polymerase sigma factor (sigma-70 family)